MEDIITTTEQEDFAAVRRRNNSFKLKETIFWGLIALVCLSRVLAYAAFYPGSSIKVILEYFSDFLVSFFVVIFPVVFQLIFGKLPLEALRLRVLASKNIVINGHGHNLYINSEPPTAEQEITPPDSELVATTAVVSSSEVKINNASQSAEFFLMSLASSSKQLATSIYGRSGVYLLVGVMVAFSGLGFFYSQTTTSLNVTDITTLMVVLIPKIGILFFIEFIAFFFLRQYRISMDEFRYYEAIKRKREETVALIKLFVEQDNPVNLMELIKLDQYFSSAGLLKKEETTEILEARKLDKNELALLDKIIDAIGQAKK